MTLKYKKITRKTWNYKKYIPRCPSKGAFEIDYKGDIYFVVNGKKHREDGPAMIRADGTRHYYQNDMLHRIDGPAAILLNGDVEYYQNNKLHRIDGPAIIRHDGPQLYYQNDLLHREDGAAWFFPNGPEYYYLFGRYYSKEDWESKVIQLSLKDQIV